MIKIKPNTCVVVVSRGRSGTSMIAGVLHHLGVCMGENLMQANHNNPLGFFEDLEFHQLHVKMCGDWKSPVINLSNLEEYQKLIQKKDKQKLWGLKDPLLCFLLPEFAENLIASNLKIIDISRDINESIASLMNRDLYWSTLNFSPAVNPMTYNQACSICEIYDNAKQQCLNNFKNTQILKLRHNEVIQNPAKSVQAIAQFIGSPVKQEAVDFIKPSLVNRKKCVFRWTIGPVKEEGFSTLFKSVESVKKLYPEAELVICYNQLTKKRIKLIEKLNVELIDQSQVKSTLIDVVPDGYKFHWKLIPVRIRPKKHEIFIDNDIVLFKRVPEIDVFLLSDLIMCYQGLNICYGAFENKVAKGIRVNAGIFGLPPNFDFESELKQVIDGISWNEHFDEQGIVAATLHKHKHVIISQTTIPIIERGFDINAFLLNVSVCGFHFVGVNYCDNHAQWLVFKDSLNHKHF